MNAEDQVTILKFWKSHENAIVQGVDNRRTPKDWLHYAKSCLYVPCGNIDANCSWLKIEKSAAILDLVARLEQQDEVDYPFIKYQPTGPLALIDSSTLEVSTTIRPNEILKQWRTSIEPFLVARNSMNETLRAAGCMGFRINMHDSRDSCATANHVTGMVFITKAIGAIDSVCKAACIIVTPNVEYHAEQMVGTLFEDEYVNYRERMGDLNHN